MRLWITFVCKAGRLDRSDFVTTYSGTERSLQGAISLPASTSVRSIHHNLVPPQVRQTLNLPFNRCYFSFCILFENEPGSIQLCEETRRRIRINLDSSGDDILAVFLPKQLVAFAPDR